MSFTVPTEYDGREQAFVRHELLRHYLEKLIMIIGTSARRVGQVEICYVDYFSGPWGADGEGLEGTSISLSLGILSHRRAALAKLCVVATVRALYIEKSRRAFKRLEAFLATYTPEGIATRALNGDFLELQQEILHRCGSGTFTFFFVDPKGWKEIAPEKIAQLVRRPRSEFLINFAFNNINRTVSMAAWRDEMRQLLGASVAVDDLEPAGRETALANAYRRALAGCITPKDLRTGRERCTSQFSIRCGSEPSIT
ncbi:three-Cys-motif partner protein TcmP [Paraburkholderia caribensis]|uniref:three-Cys-motif partner protein TcmP n=1 Tax=Paraburkholderia caribensis TaxID=75105 RepID=UPI0034D277A3